DRNRSHWSTSKTPSYTKSVSWQHHLIVCSPVLLWEQYSGIKTFIKRISRYRTDDFILSKKTAKERLNMQLLRSNNWENYYTSF
ncbi:hypothetical protein OSK19_22625, partial [Escherichia coli]|nr:hypothetical protein [Escherichia coli]